MDTGAREHAEARETREARERLRRRSHELRRERAALAATARGAADDLAAVSRAQLARRPYLTLGAAFATGYVLGGGLPPGLVAAAAGMGMRAAVMGLLRNAVAPADLGPEEPGAPETGPSGSQA